MLVRGGIKNCFFYFQLEKGRVSANPKNPYQNFLTKGGAGSHQIQKGSSKFFGIICQKKGGYIKNWKFFYHFSLKRGGSMPSKKNHYS